MSDELNNNEAESTEAAAAEAPVEEAPEVVAEESIATAEEAPAADEAAEEAPVAEAAAEDAPVEVDATPEPEAAEPVEEEAAPVEETTAEVEPEVEATPVSYGYTGEITGRVVKLEELAAAEEDADEVARYAQLQQMIEQTLTNVSEHEIVRGRVVSVGDKDVVIDIGFKSDGIVAKNEFDETLEAGAEVDVYLERLEDYHGQLVLSKTKADKVRRWQRIEDAYESESVLEGTIVRRIKGGMIVELFEGMEAFLPGSQIDVRPVRDFDAYLERRMEFKIVKLNPTNENIVVSHKALIEKDLEEQRRNILSTMEPGQVLEGTVKNITDFGVFIDLGGVDGLLHITDLSWGRVSHPSELVSLDDKLNIVVLDYDKERQRISLGLKQLQPHPWENIEEKFKNDDVVEGKVVSITDYGAFVELEKGIEGLVHISEMSWTEHIKHPSQAVSLGQMVQVKILNIDLKGRKISLGMKQLEPDPWENISERYPAGTVLAGKVRNITNFGVFVEIEPGIDGLVHISDLSWTKRIRHPAEFVKKGQGLDVVILNIDQNDRRISLGHKQVSTNPWNDFAKIYAVGSDTEATVARIESDGVIVDLPLDVEGFLPPRELKQGRNFQEFYKAKQKLNLRVIRFDAAQKEIVLSEVEVERAQERAEKEAENQRRRDERDAERREVRTYKKRVAASGPTTLGELSGLEDLRARLQAAEAEAAAAQAAQTEGNGDVQIEESSDEEA